VSPAVALDISSVRPWTRRTAAWLLAVAALAVPLTLGVGRFVLHMNVAAVLTGSMRPTFSPGDATVTQAVPSTDIRPGMVVLAVPPGQSTPYAHRVITVHRHGGTVTVQTRGDANAAPDAWTDTFRRGTTAQRVVGVVPKLGYLLAGFQQTRNSSALPFLVAGLLLTAVATSFVLYAGPTPGPRLSIPATNA
jgi:signal peptidase